MHLKTQISYSDSEESALSGAYDQWRTNIFSPTELENMYKVEYFDAAAKKVKPDDMKEMIRISSNVDKHINWIKQDHDLGFTNIILHNVNREQERFINDFGDKVLLWL